MSPASGFRMLMVKPECAREAGKGDQRPFVTAVCSSPVVLTLGEHRSPREGWSEPTPGPAPQN